MDTIYLSKHDHKIDRGGLIGLVLLGFMLWSTSSLWGHSETRGGQFVFERLTGETTSLATHQGTLAACPVKSTPPPDRVHSTDEAFDTSAPLEAPRDGASEPIDTRRHPFHTAVRDRRFAALLFLLANSRH